MNIVAYGNDHWVIISQPDWALIGGYIYSAQSYIRSAGPCLRSLRGGSDVEPGTNGVVKQ